MGIKRAVPNRPRRNRNPMINQPEKNNPVVIMSAEKSGSALTLTFTGPVSLERGAVPGITTDVSGALPESASLLSPNQVAIQYSAAITAATSLNIPFRDPAIRNSSGGYVISTTFPLAA